MKKFSFPLNTVLDYKNQVLDTLKNEHAKAMKNVIEQEKLIDELLDDYQLNNEKFKQKKISGISISEANTYETYFRQLEHNIKMERNKLAYLKEQLEKKRLEVVEARTETASIEKLKENKLKEYNKELLKAQELLVEEYVSHLRAAHGNA